MIRLDACVMPALSLGVVHNKHMVGEVFAEPELGGIGLCFGCGGLVMVIFIIGNVSFMLSFILLIIIQKNMKTATVFEIIRVFSPHAEKTMASRKKLLKSSRFCCIITC